MAFFGEREAAAPLIEEGYAIAKKIGDRRLKAKALAVLTYASTQDMQSRLQTFNEAVALFRAAGDERNTARTLSWLSEQYFQAGEPELAMENNRQALAILRRRRFRSALIVALMNNAGYALWLERYDDAREDARESISLCEEIQDHLDVPICIQHLATVADARGDASTAARLLGFVDARFVQIDEPRQLTEQMLCDRLMRSLREKLSETQLAALMSDGALLREDEAIAQALEV
jgi:tetratricopeptide (TPR) repeat protein